MKTITWHFEPKLQEKWRNAAPPTQWKKEYSDLFDDQDLQLAQRQRSYQFGEWYVAIKYHKQGYKVLLEKHCFKKHQRKYKELGRRIGEEGLRFLCRKNVQPPDLFVYDQEKFFFVEVKLEDDGLKKKQEEFFQQIERHFNSDVFICRLKSSVRATEATTKEYATSTWKLSFKELKNETQALLKVSKRAKYKEDAGAHADYIDKSAIPFVERIDGNPSLTTAASCSGHDHANKSDNGRPFILVAFKDMKTMQKYEKKLKHIGITVERQGRKTVVNRSPDGTAYVTTRDSGLGPQQPILQVQPKRQSPRLAHAFWESCTRILEG